VEIITHSLTMSIVVGDCRYSLCGIRHTSDTWKYASAGPTCRLASNLFERAVKSGYLMEKLNGPGRKKR
jgi:hypothetical protein